jgi:hypothetical protein
MSSAPADAANRKLILSQQLFDDDASGSDGSNCAVLPNNALTLRNTGENKLMMTGGSNDLSRSLHTVSKRLTQDSKNKSRDFHSAIDIADAPFVQGHYQSPRELPTNGDTKMKGFLNKSSHLIGKFRKQPQDVLPEYNDPRTFAEFGEWFEHCRDTGVLRKLHGLHESQQDSQSYLKRHAKEPYSPSYDAVFRKHIEEEEKCMREATRPISSNSWKSPIIQDALRLKESHVLSKNGDENGLSMRFPRHILIIMRFLPGNCKCCDCGSPDGNVSGKQITWASIALGTIICDDCAFRHMIEGRENEIKNLETDLDWKCTDVISMLEGGNENFLLETCCIHGKGRDTSIVTPGPAVSYGDINGIYSSRSSHQYRKMLRNKVLKVLN